MPSCLIKMIVTHVGTGAACGPQSYLIPPSKVQLCPSMAFKRSPSDVVSSSLGVSFVCILRPAVGRGKEEAEWKKQNVFAESSSDIRVSGGDTDLKPSRGCIGLCSHSIRCVQPPASEHFFKRHFSRKCVKIFMLIREYVCRAGDNQQIV